MKIGDNFKMKITDFNNLDLICLKDDPVHTARYKVHKSNVTLKLFNLDTIFFVHDFILLNREDWIKIV